MKKNKLDNFEFLVPPTVEKTKVKSPAYTQLRGRKFKTSHKRGQKRPKEFLALATRVRKLEEQGYRFDKDFISLIIEFYDKLVGYKLSKAQEDYFKQMTDKYLKEKAILKPHQKDNQKIQQTEGGDSFGGALPSEEDIIRSQIDRFKNTLEPGLKNIYEAILQHFTFDELKQLIEKGELPMWVADSDAIIQLKVAINSFPQHIQNMIQDLYDVMSISMKVR